MSRRSLSVLILLAIFLTLSLFTLVDADTLENNPIARAFVNKAAPKHPLASVSQDLHQVQRVRLDALEARIKKAADPEEAFALEREYQHVKMETELRMLQIQLEHFEKTGNTAAAARMREAVTNMETLLAKSERRHRDYRSQ